MKLEMDSQVALTCCPDITCPNFSLRNEGMGWLFTDVIIPQGWSLYTDPKELFEVLSWLEGW